MLFAALRIAGEILHFVGGSRAVPAFENLSHLLCHSLHILRLTAPARIDGSIRSTRMKYCCTVIGITHGFGIQFRFAEAFDLLLERADHGELQTVNLDLLTYCCVLAAIEPLRQLVRQQRDLLPQVDVARVEKPSGQHLEIADRLVVFIRAEHENPFFFPVQEHRVVVGLDPRRRDDASGKLLADRLHVGDLDEIGIDFRGRGLGSDLIRGEDHVRPHAFDLLENVVLAGE